MTLVETLKKWFTAPPIETASHQCIECGTVAGPEDAACPTCGGEVRHTRTETHPIYWGDLY